MNKKTDEIEIDLLHLAAVVWKNIVAIILVAVIVGGMCYAGTKAFITPKYNSRTYLFVNMASNLTGLQRLSLNTTEMAVAKNLVDTYLVILNSRLTLEEVIERSGVTYSYEDLQKMLNCTAVENTSIFYVDVTSTDPAEAELIANTIAVVLPEKIGSIIEGASARIVDSAVRATKRSSPSYIGNAAKGAVFAVILASGVAILVDLMDEKIHDTDYLTKTYENVPVLAAIPDLMTKQKQSNYYYQSPSKGSK